MGHGTQFKEQTLMVLRLRAPLLSGGYIVITFCSNTAGFVCGNYTISTFITLAPGETNNGTGEFTYGTVEVTIPGDVNGDGIVNILDVGVIAAHWLQTAPPSAPPELANADVNGDGIVNILDVRVIAAHWLQTISP
jgi:hypothetical protein